MNRLEIYTSKAIKIQNPLKSYYKYQISIMIFKKIYMLNKDE